MQKVRTRIICGLALLIALGVATAAIAQRRGGHGGHGGGDSSLLSSSVEGRGGAFGLGRFAGLLNLTDAQRTQIVTITTNYLTSTETLRDQLEDLRDANPLNQVTTTFDEAAVRQAAQARAAVQVELEVAYARAQAQVYNVLTAEQRTLLTQLTQQRQSRHNSWSGTTPVS